MFKQKIRKLRAIRPNITISSDFIVGFPGETEEDFEKLMKLVKDIHFDHSFSFLYSKRPGTPAADLPDDTPIEVKKERLQRLQDLLKNNALIISRQMIDSVQSLLVEGSSSKTTGILVGRTENNRIVYFAGDESLLGNFVNVKITEASPNSLKGELV